MNSLPTPVPCMVQPLVISLHVNVQGESMVKPGAMPLVGTVGTQQKKRKPKPNKKTPTQIPDNIALFSFSNPPKEIAQRIILEPFSVSR